MTDHTQASNTQPSPQNKGFQPLAQASEHQTVDQPFSDQEWHADEFSSVRDKLIQSYTNLLCIALKTIQLCRSLDITELPAIINGEHTTSDQIGEAFQVASATRIGVRRRLLELGLQPAAIFELERSFLDAGITEPIVIGAL